MSNSSVAPTVNMHFVNPLTHIIGGKYQYGKHNPENISVHPFADLNECIKVEYFPETEVAVAFDGINLEFESQVVDVVDINPWTPSNEHSFSDEEAVSEADSNDTWLSSTATEATGWTDCAPKYTRKPNHSAFQPDPAKGTFEEQWEQLSKLQEEHNESIEAEHDEYRKSRKERTKNWVREHVVILQLPDDEDFVFEDALEYLEVFGGAPEPKDKEKTQTFNGSPTKRCLKWIMFVVLAWLVLRGVQKEFENFRQLQPFENEDARVEVAALTEPEMAVPAAAEVVAAKEPALEWGVVDWSKMTRFEYWNCIAGWRNTEVCGFWLMNPRPKAPGGYW